MISSAIAGVDYAVPAISERYTMLASKWAYKKYSFEDTYPSDHNDISIEISDSATAA
mgnify:CR=1 FL=1